MPASEKLKALDAEMEGGWGRISPGEPLIEGPFAKVAALISLRNALPQIVAVVEAAENFDMEQHRSVRTETIWTQLHAALSALEEALGGDVT